RGVPVDVALDAVAREPGDLLDGGVEVDERPQRAVAEAVARHAGGEDIPYEGRLEQRLVGARDADGDRLRLVLDCIDRTGELGDAVREGGGEVLDAGAGSPALAQLALVRGGGRRPRREAQPRRDPHRAARTERAVVRAGGEPVEEAGRRRGAPGGEP